jgi:glucokinase
MILAGDIGGTKTALGLYESPAEGRRTLRTATYSSREHSDFENVLAVFLGGEERAIEHACLGIAGPVLDNRVKTSNLPWTIDGAEIARAFSIPRVELINDLVAMGEGIETLAAEDFAVLQQGIADEAGQAALVAPGTGLGIAILQRAEGRLVPLPSEGGHADFSAQSDDEIELLRSLRARFGQVCSEHVVSGPGLVNIYRHLRDRAPAEESAELRAALEERDPAEVIGSWGTTGKSALCAQSLDLFVRAWGRLAGNVALLALATGGVYVGGGIAPRYIELLEDGRFLAAFRDKGSYAPLLERIPVRVILEPTTPLRGAARRAQRALGG